MLLAYGTNWGAKYTVWEYDGGAFVISTGGIVHWIEFPKAPFSERVRIQVEGDEFRQVSQMKEAFFSESESWEKVELGGRRMYVDNSGGTRVEFKDGECISARFGPNSTTKV
jgi:hypothetical protein